MLVHLDAREREQVFDEAGHALAVLVHDGEEALARGRIVAGSPLQRLDEAHERGERRADLVARVGDEVGPHLVGAAHCREIDEREQNSGAAFPRLGQRLDPRREGAFDRRLQRELDVAPVAAVQGLLDGLDQCRIAQGGRNVAPGHLAIEELRCRPVGAHDLAVGIQQQERLGQGIERAFELGSLAGKLRLALGAEPGQTLDRCRELAGEQPCRRSALVRLALSLGGGLHVAREGVDLSQHQADHSCREQAETGPGKHRRDGRREAKCAEHQECEPERQRRRKAQARPSAQRNDARAAIDRLSSAAGFRALESSRATRP